MRVLITALLCAIPLLAQEAPDAKAYQAAYRLKEPAAKLAALDQFLAEFPSSNRAGTARREVISTALAVNPKDAVRRTRAMTQALPAAESAELNRFLAAELTGAKKLPKDAVRAARLALAQYTWESFTAQAKGETPSRARYDGQRARMSETLGQALLARGKRAEAKPVFLEALQANPSFSAAALALGDIFLKDGKGPEALGYYAQGMLARATPESRQKFSDAYRKVKGSAGGEQEFLDERYKALFPNPLHAEKYVRSGQPAGRVVLAEVYTGAGCPPCVAADLSFDAILERYSRSDVAVVMYHEHVPRPDPMSNTDTVARWKWQAGRGVPTYAIDGSANTGGGSREMASGLEAKIRESVEKRLAVAPSAALQLAATNDGRQVRASVSVTEVAQDSADLVLNVLLLEKELRYSGENGVRFHPMVVRSIASFPLQGGKAKAETHVFDLKAVAAGLEKHIADFEKFDERHNKDGRFRFMEYKSALDATDLAVVAFVQDVKTKAVLQSVYAEARP